MVNVIPCTPEHIRQIDVALTSTERRIREENAENGRQWLSQCARTLVDDDRVLACFGVSILWPGVGHAWAMISEEARKYPLALTRSIFREMQRFEAEHRLRRLEAAVKIESIRGRRWLEILGFGLERGLVRNYGMDGIGDYAMYARCH